MILLGRFEFVSVLGVHSDIKGFFPMEAWSEKSGLPWPKFAIPWHSDDLSKGDCFYPRFFLAVALSLVHPRAAFMFFVNQDNSLFQKVKHL